MVKSENIGAKSVKFKANRFLPLTSLWTSFIFCNINKILLNYVSQLPIIKQVRIFLHVFLVTTLTVYNYCVPLFHVAHLNHFSTSSEPFLRRPYNIYFSLCLCKRSGGSESAMEPNLTTSRGRSVFF